LPNVDTSAAREVVETTVGRRTEYLAAGRTQPSAECRIKTELNGRNGGDPGNSAGEKNIWR
jgi:hypothetical protein